MAKAIEVMLGPSLSTCLRGDRGPMCSQDWAMFVPLYYKQIRHLALVIFNDTHWHALKERQNGIFLGIGPFQNHVELRDSLHAPLGVLRKGVNECFQQEMFFKVFLPCCSDRAPTSPGAMSCPTTPNTLPQGCVEDPELASASKRDFNESKCVTRVQSKFRDM